ncbi:MAG: potassium channel family protein [Gammaproteobacteria bacterium]|nr:potassium channel family protein [Gammaproteobacteria bacterium]
MRESQAAHESGDEHPLQKSIKKANYVFLFIALTVILIVGPAFHELLPPAASSIITTSCFTGAMLIGIFSLTNSRVAFRAGAALAIAVTILFFVEVFYTATGFSLLALNLLLAFLLLSAWHAGRDVLFGGEVTLNRIVGAMCIYEMIGLIWAVMFTGIAHLTPQAFTGAGTGEQPFFWDFVYYSFVTLTTLGYGDITPHAPFAKSLAYMEALIGQLYIAVLIASLVGSHLSKTNPR